LPRFFLCLYYNKHNQLWSTLDEPYRARLLMMLKLTAKFAPPPVYDVSTSWLDFVAPSPTASKPCVFYYPSTGLPKLCYRTSWATVSYIFFTAATMSALTVSSFF